MKALEAFRGSSNLSLSVKEIKMSLLNQKTNKKELKNDNYQTPWYAIKPLEKYIPRDWILWDCACGDGNIVEFFNNNSYSAIGTDILISNEHDFLVDWHFVTDSADECDCIITNPPFSLKTEFLERAKCFGKPFAFLMNVTSLETQRRQKVFQDEGMQLLLPNKRISYIVDGVQTTSSWFYSAWFLFGFNLEHDINYVEINK